MSPAPITVAAASLLLATCIQANGYSEYAGYNCYNDHGATDLEDTAGSDCGQMSLAACEAACDSLEGCTAITFSSDFKCYRRTDIVLANCDENSDYDTYIQDAGDDTSCTPEGEDEYQYGYLLPCCDGLVADLEYVDGDYRYICISTTDDSDTDDPDTDDDAGSRLASYFILGDWGYDSQTHDGSLKPACQQAIADLMKSTYEEEGDVEFVVNVGDSFYPSGTGFSGTDSQWESKFLNVYGNVATDIPWYSVYGNHDYEGSDACGCSMNTSGCAQVNSGVGGWYMPDRSYYVTDYVDKYDVEIVAFDIGDAFTSLYNEGSPCYYAEMYQSDCGSCYDIMGDIYEQGVALMQERIEQSSANNLIIFSHYPTSYLNDLGILDPLTTSSKNIEYYGGHTHEVVENFWPTISPNQEWLVGGGGGWGCDGANQGFVLAKILEDGTVTHEFKGVDTDVCCYWTLDHELGNYTGSKTKIPSNA